MFKEYNREIVAQMLQLTKYYPSFVDEEQNLALLDEVLLVEVKEVVQMDFFFGFMNLFEQDLVVFI